MKKITLVSIATLALFLGGCAQQEAESKSSQEQSTEQVSSSSEVSTSSSSTTDVLQGRSAYDVYVAKHGYMTPTLLRLLLRLKKIWQSFSQ